MIYFAPLEHAAASGRASVVPSPHAGKTSNYQGVSR
jgi:hypothetical protein